MNYKKQVYVIGAGASGMMAAIAAKRNGFQVTILEGMNQAGKKILMTGNGKCNLSNDVFHFRCYHNENTEFLRNIFSQFTVEQTCQFFEELGLFITKKNGYLYPNSMQASSVAKILNDECNQIGIQICYQNKVKEIKKKKNHYLLYTEHKIYEADIIILAAGSMAYPKTGSDGSGYHLLRKLGCNIIAPLPALTGLKCKEKYCKNFAGVRVKGTVYMQIDGKKVAEDTGEIQLTNYGVSGIPIFQISRYASRALYAKKKVTVFLDFMSNINFFELYEIFRKKCNRYPKKTIADQFVGVLNDKLVNVILETLQLNKNTMSKEITESVLKKIISKVKKFELHVIGTNGYEQSQVCCGGLDIKEVDSKTLQIKKYPGIYVAGEILNVDGICGGYNLQWAWSSGYVAGQIQTIKNREGKKYDSN